MEKIIIFPGTFDPIHSGHIEAAISAYKEIKADKITFVLQQNRFKGSSMFTFDYRLNLLIDMVVKLKEKRDVNCDFLTTDREYFYTFAVENYSFRNDVELYLLLGDDALDGFNKWYQYEDVLRHFNLIIVQRDYGDTHLYSLLSELEAPRYTVIQNVSSMSSTNIRDIISKLIKAYTI